MDNKYDLASDEAVEWIHEMEERVIKIEKRQNWLFWIGLGMIVMAVVLQVV